MVAVAAGNHYTITGNVCDGASFSDGRSGARKLLQASCPTKPESTMIRLALTVLPLAAAGAAHAQQVRAALHYPQANCRLHDIVLFQPPHGSRDCSFKKTPCESFDREKTGGLGDGVSPLSMRLAQPSQ